MAFFKRSRKFWPILLGIWLIASGVLPLLGTGIPYSGPALNLLAIAAGVLVLIDR